MKDPLTGSLLCEGCPGIDFWHLCYVEAMKALIVYGVEKLKRNPGEHISDTLARQAAAAADAMTRNKR